MRKTSTWTKMAITNTFKIMGVNKRGPYLSCQKGSRILGMEQNDELCKGSEKLDVGRINWNGYERKGPNPGQTFRNR